MCFQQLLSGSELHFLAYVNNFYLGSFFVMLFANVLEIHTIMAEGLCYFKVFTT